MSEQIFSASRPLQAPSQQQAQQLSIAGKGLVHSLGDYNALCRAYDNGDTCPAQSDLPKVDTAALADFLPKNVLRRIPRYARMGLLAAQRALDDSGLELKRENIGLVIGTAHAGVQMSMDFMDSILDGTPRLSSPTSFSHAVNNMGAGLLSLYLGLRAPCHTVTQFTLSFAGALQTASTILHAGRAEYVLVGAIDEQDPRFVRTCPQDLLPPQNSPYAHLPLTEGAVFFLVGKANAKEAESTNAGENAPVQISQVWQNKNSSPYAQNVLQHPFGMHASLYGITPMAQALDVLIALHNMKNTQTTHVISCADAHYASLSCIQLGI